MRASAEADPSSVWRFDAIGAPWQIETTRPLGSDVRLAVEDTIAAFDREWSRFRSDSLVALLAQGARELPAPCDAADMLDAFVAFDRATAAAVNPLVGASLSARGYDAGYGLIDHGALPAPADWRERLEWTDELISLSAPGVSLHHVVDARTGEPVRTIAATWAIAPSAMRADAVATALFFDGGPELAFEWGIEWVRMSTDGRVEWSPGSCLLYTSPSPRDKRQSRMPSSA